MYEWVCTAFGENALGRAGFASPFIIPGYSLDHWPHLLGLFVTSLASSSKHLDLLQNVNIVMIYIQSFSCQILQVCRALYSVL